MTAASHVGYSGLIAENCLATDFFADGYETSPSGAPSAVRAFEAGCGSEDNITSDQYVTAPNGVGVLTHSVWSSRHSALGIIRAVYSSSATPSIHNKGGAYLPLPCLPKFRRSGALQIKEVSRNNAERLEALRRFEVFTSAFLAKHQNSAAARDVASFALNIARKIPLDVAFPKVTASEDSEIVLTWFRKGGRIEAILQPDGYLTWVRSQNRKYYPGGDRPFSDPLAASALLLSLWEFYSGDYSG